MPVRYVAEMFVDRIAASKTYQKENYRDEHPLAYYERGAARLGRMILFNSLRQTLDTTARSLPLKGADR